MSIAWQLTRRPGRYPNPGFEINGELVDYTNGEYGPDIASDYLCDFIERNKDEAFFAYYPMILPHSPFIPTPDSPEYDNGKNVKSEKRFFVDMVAYTDKMVGKIASKLEALDIAENTLLIFTCDNGTHTGITSQFDGKNYQGGKGKTKDNGTHVPMVAHWPGTIKPGQVTDALVDFSDVIPTITEVADVPVPAELGLRGHSFAPLLKGQDFTPREWIYCWYERNGKRPTAKEPGVKYSEHVRNERYKLYRTGEFYDVIDDFAQQSPIDTQALPEQLTGIYHSLKTALDEHVAITEKANPVVVDRLLELDPSPAPKAKGKTGAAREGAKPKQQKKNKKKAKKQPAAK